jgi:hypothetical protein
MISPSERINITTQAQCLEAVNLIGGIKNKN